MNLPSSWGFKDTFCELNIVVVFKKKDLKRPFYLVSIPFDCAGVLGGEGF